MTVCTRTTHTLKPGMYCVLGAIIRHNEHIDEWTKWQMFSDDMFKCISSLQNEMMCFQLQQIYTLVMWHWSYSVSNFVTNSRYDTSNGFQSIYFYHNGVNITYMECWNAKYSVMHEKATEYTPTRSVSLQVYLTFLESSPSTLLSANPQSWFSCIHNGQQEKIIWNLVIFWLSKSQRRRIEKLCAMILHVIIWHSSCLLCWRHLLNSKCFHMNLFGE